MRNAEWVRRDFFLQINPARSLVSILGSEKKDRRIKINDEVIVAIFKLEQEGVKIVRLPEEEVYAD